MLPLLISHSGKIADVHRHRHPELPRVAQVVRQIADEMTAHMMKEEQILFPYIVRLAVAKAGGLAAPSAPFGSSSIRSQDGSRARVRWSHHARTPRVDRRLQAA